MPSSHTSIAEDEHGTSYGAAQRCRVVNGSACARCGPVIAVYMQEWRRRNPFGVERNKMLTRARQRALTRLGQRYPVELEELYQEELGRERESPEGTVWE